MKPQATNVWPASPAEPLCSGKTTLPKSVCPSAPRTYFHQAIWQSKVSHKRKLELVARSTGFSHCVHKGRNGGWLAAKGLEDLVYGIQHATSSSFQALMDAVPENAASGRAQLLGFQTDLRNKLVNIVSSKFAFWMTILWRAFAIFYFAEQEHNEVEARRICGECLAEYDRAVISGSDRVHRVAKMMFGPGENRAGFDDYANGQRGSLKDFPRIFLLLQKYSLANVTERRIEQIHSQVKTIGKDMPHVEPPYICARLREEKTLDRVRSNPDFRKFCTGKWRSTKLLSDVLELRLTSAELQGMTRRTKVKRICM